MGSTSLFVVRQPYNRHGSGSRMLVLLLAMVGGTACSSVPGAHANSDGAALGNHDGSASDEGETNTGGSYGGGIDGGGLIFWIQGEDFAGELVVALGLSGLMLGRAGNQRKEKDG